MVPSQSPRVEITPKQGVFQILVKNALGGASLSLVSREDVVFAARQALSLAGAGQNKVELIAPEWLKAELEMGGEKSAT
jgi:hypothetical protein